MGLKRHFCTALLSILCLGALSSQESQNILDNNYYFPSSNDYFDDQLFGLSLKQFESGEVNADNISKAGWSSHELGEHRSIDLLLESIARNNDPVFNNETYLIVARRYFENRDYLTARSYFTKLNQSIMPPDQRPEVNFKLGYSYLTQKNFQEAQGYFSKANATPSVYKNDAIYYSGICHYYLNEKEQAIANFEQVENNAKYRNLIPFYFAQIYFKDAEYDKAIEYAQSRLAKANSNDKSKLNRILGLSYFAQEEYAKALPYLDAYAEESPAVTENELYQIGLIHYNLNNKEKSAEYFKELSHQDSEIGQKSNYLLASSSIDLGKKKDAQSAFKQASKLGYFTDIQSESSYQYYKISAELGDERIAINGLTSVSPNSQYYNESQDILAVLFLNTKDYQNTLTQIEQLDQKSASILETYQILSFEHGIQLLNDQQYNEALIQFGNVINTNPNHELSKKSHYWKAFTYDKLEDAESSYDAIADYLDSGHSDYKFEAYYLKAYNDIEGQRYGEALTSLENAANSFDMNSDDRALFDDAIVRLADLELVNNNYDAALEYYDLAIQNNVGESDYILYQKSLIYGVNNQLVQKLTSLERLIKEFPQSEYRDDALFQVGETLVDLKKNNEAFQIFNSIIFEYGSKSPYTPICYMRQGLLSYNNGDLYAALDAYKQGLETTKDNEEIRRALLAVEEIYLNELDDPDSYFKFKEEYTGLKIDDITKDSIAYHVALETYKSTDYEKAVQQLQAYINRYKQGFYLSDAHYYSAEANSVLKQYGEALPHYEIVVENQNSRFYAESLRKAALISFNFKKDFALAYRYYDKLIEENISNTKEDLEYVFYSAEATSLNDGLKKYGPRIIESSESSPLKAKAYYYLSKIALVDNDLQLAKSHISELLKLDKGKMAAEASYLLSKILFDEEDLENAEKQAFETTKIAANYPQWVAKSIILIADIYVKKKDYLNATAAYESIIENFKEDASLLAEAQQKLADLNALIEAESRIVDPNQGDFIQTDTIR